MKKEVLSKSIVGILVAVVFIIGVMAACAQPAPIPKSVPTPTPAPPPAKVETITLNYAAFIPANHPEMVGYKKQFIDKAVELSKGRLAFNFRGGPETIPTNDLPKATQSGMVDFSLNLAGMVEALVPGVGATTLSQISVDDERKNGAYAYMDELCRKAGLTYMGRLSPAADLQFLNLFLNKKVEKKDDFKGLRLGTATAARYCTEGWGATPVMLAMSDYYTAMERGTVDGVSGSTLVNWTSIGAQAITKYMALPGYLTGSQFIMMNLNVWNKLPPDLQKVITDSMISSEKELTKTYLADKEASMQKLREAKVEIYTLAPDVAKWLVDTAYEATWAAQLQRFPNETPKLKQLFSGGK